MASGEQLAPMEDWFGFAELTEDVVKEVNKEPVNNQPPNITAPTRPLDVPPSNKSEQNLVPCKNDGQIVVPIVSKHFGIKKFKVLARQKAEDDEDCKKRDEKKEAKNVKDEKGISKVAKLENPTKCEVSKIKTLSEKNLVTKPGNDKIIKEELLPKPKKKTQGKKEAKCNLRQKVSQNLISKDKKLKEVKKITKIKQVNCTEPVENVVHDSGKVSLLEKAETLSQKETRDPIQPSFKLKCNSVDLNECSVSLKRDSSIDNIQILMIKDKSECEARSVLGDEINARIDGENTVKSNTDKEVESPFCMDEVKNDMVFGVDIDLRKSGRLKSSKCASRYRGDYGIRADAYTKLLQKIQTPSDSEESVHSKHSEDNMESMHRDEMKKSFPVNTHKKSVREQNREQLDSKRHSVRPLSRGKCKTRSRVAPKSRASLDLKVAQNTNYSMHQSDGKDEHVLKRESQAHGMSSKEMWSSLEHCGGEETVGNERVNPVKLDGEQYSGECSGYTVLEKSAECPDVVPLKVKKCLSESCDTSQQSSKNVESAADCLVCGQGELTQTQDTAVAIIKDTLLVKPSGSYVHSVGKSVMKKQNQVECKKVMNKQTLNAEDPFSPVASPEKLEPSKVLESLRCKLFERAGANIEEADEKPKVFECKLITSQIKEKNRLDDQHISEVSSIKSGRSTPQQKHDSSGELLEEVAKTLDILHKKKRKTLENAEESSSKKQRFEQKSFMLRSKVKRLPDVDLESAHLSISDLKDNKKRRISVEEIGKSSGISEDLYKMNEGEEGKNDKQDDRKSLIDVDSDEESTSTQNDDVHENSNKDSRKAQSKQRSVKCQACGHVFKSRDLLRKHYPCRIRQTRTWSQNKLRPKRALERQTSSSNKKFVCKLPKSSKTENKVRPQLMTFRKTKFRRVKGKRRRKLYQLIQELIGKRKVISWPHLKIKFNDLSFKEQSLYKVGLMCVGNANEGLGQYSDPELQLFEHHRQMEKNVELSSELFLQNLSKEENLGRELNAETLVSVRQACDDLSNSSVCEDGTTVEEGSQHDSPKSVKTQEVRNNTAQTDNIVNLLSLSPIVNCQKSSNANEFTNDISSTEKTSSSVKDNGEDIENQVLKICDTSKSPNQVCNSGIANTSEICAVSNEMLISCNSENSMVIQNELEQETEEECQQKSNKHLVAQLEEIVVTDVNEVRELMSSILLNIELSVSEINTNLDENNTEVPITNCDIKHSQALTDSQAEIPSPETNLSFEAQIVCPSVKEQSIQPYHEESEFHTYASPDENVLNLINSPDSVNAETTSSHDNQLDTENPCLHEVIPECMEKEPLLEVATELCKNPSVHVFTSESIEEESSLEVASELFETLSVSEIPCDKTEVTELALEVIQAKDSEVDYRNQENTIKDVSNICIEEKTKNTNNLEKDESSGHEFSVLCSTEILGPCNELCQNNVHSSSTCEQPNAELKMGNKPLNVQIDHENNSEDYSSSHQEVTPSSLNENTAEYKDPEHILDVQATAEHEKLVGDPTSETNKEVSETSTSTDVEDVTNEAVEDNSLDSHLFELQDEHGHKSSISDVSDQHKVEDSDGIQANFQEKEINYVNINSASSEMTKETENNLLHVCKTKQHNAEKKCSEDVSDLDAQREDEEETDSKLNNYCQKGVVIYGAYFTHQFVEKMKEKTVPCSTCNAEQHDSHTTRECLKTIQVNKCPVSELATLQVQSEYITSFLQDTPSFSNDADQNVLSRESLLYNDVIEEANLNRLETLSERESDMQHLQASHTEESLNMGLCPQSDFTEMIISGRIPSQQVISDQHNNSDKGTDNLQTFFDDVDTLTANQQLVEEEQIINETEATFVNQVSSSAHAFPIQEKESGVVEDSWEQAVDFDDKVGQQISSNKITLLMEVKDNPKQNDDVKTTQFKVKDYAHGISFSYNETVQPESMKDDERDEAHTIFDKKMALQDVTDNDAQYENECDDRTALMDDVKDVYVQEDEVTNNFDEKITLSENRKHVYDEIEEASENYNNKTKPLLTYQDDYDQHELYKANDNKTVFLEDLDNVDDIEGEGSNIKGRKLQINDEAKAINMNNDKTSLEDGKNSYDDQNVARNMYVDKRTDIMKEADDQVEISNSFDDKTALAEDVKNVGAQEDVTNICTDEIDEDVKRVDDIMNLMEDFCMKVRMSLSYKDTEDSAKMNREEVSSEGTLPLDCKTLDDPGLVPVTSRDVPSVSFVVEATPGKQTADKCHILPEQSQYKMLESTLEETASQDRDILNQSSDMSCDPRNSELLHLVGDKNMNDKPDNYPETLKDPQIEQVNLEHSSDERGQTAVYANEEGTTVLVAETNDNEPETRSTANRTGEKSFITMVSPHLDQQFNTPVDKEDSVTDSEGLSDHEEMEDTDSSIPSESSCRSEISNKQSLEGQCKTPCAHLNKDKDSPQANTCTHANMPCNKVNPKESSYAQAKDLDSSDESSVPVQKKLIDESSMPIQKILIDESSMPIQKILISPQTEFTIKYEVNGIMIQENLLTGDKSVIENHDSSESDFALSHHTSDVDKDEIMKEENSEDSVTEDTTLVETHKENTVKHAIDTKKTYGNSTTESNFESMPLKENQTPNINLLNEDDIDEMRHDAKEHEDPFNTSNLISECSIASTLQDTTESCEDIKSEVLIERDLVESPPFLEKMESIQSESLKEVPDQAYEWVDSVGSNESGPPLLEPESSLTIEPGCVDSDSSNKENITEYGSEPTSYHTSTRSKSERHFLDVLFHSDEAGKVSEESGNIIGGDGNNHGLEKESDVELQETLPVKESIGRHFSDVMDDPYSILQLRKKVEKPKLAMAKIKEFFDSKSAAKTFSKESLLKVRTGIADLLSKVKAPLKRDPTWLNRNALSEYSGKQGAMMYKKLKDKDTGKSSLTVYSDNDSDTDASDKEDESGLDYENCEHSKKKWIDDNAMCLESSTKGGITNNILQMLTSFEAKGSIADNMTSLLDILAENLGLASKSCKTSEIDSESEDDNTNETEIVPDEPSIDMVTTEDDEPPCLDDIPTAEDFRPSPSFVNKYHIQKNNEKQTEEECQTSVKNPLFFDQERENMKTPKLAADLPSYDNIKNQTENVKKSEIFEIVPDYETNSFSLSKLEPGYFESSENIIKWVQQTEESPCTNWPSEGGKKHGKLFKSITELNSIEADDSNSEDDFINVPMSQQFSELKAMTKNAASEVNSDLISKSDLDSIHEETVQPSTGSQKYEVSSDTLPKENRKTYCVAIEENSAQVDDVEEIPNFDVQSVPDDCSLNSIQEDLQQTVNKEKDSTESQDIAKQLVLTVSSRSSIKMGSELYSEKMQAEIIDKSKVANDAKVDEQGQNRNNIPDYTVTDLQNEVSENIMDFENNQNDGLDGNDKNNSDKSLAVNDYNIIPSKNLTTKEVVNVTNNDTIEVKTAACVDVHRDSGTVEDLEKRLEQIADKKADSLFVSEDSNCTIEYSEERSAEQAVHENQSCCDDLMVSLLEDNFTFCETIAEKVKRKQRERLLNSAKCKSFSFKNTAIPKPKGREISIFRSAIQEKKKMKYQKRQMSVPLDETRTRPGFARDLSVPKEFKTLPCSVKLTKIPLDILIKECCKPCSVVVRRLDKKKIKALTKTSANENHTSEKPKPPIKVKINLRTLCVAPPSPCCPESCSSSSSENRSIIDEDMERSDLDQNNFEDLEKEIDENLSSDEDSENVNVDCQKKSAGNRTPIRLNFRELLFKAKRDNEENSSDDSEALQSSLCDVEEDMKQDKESVDKLSPSQHMASDITEDDAADNCSCDELQNSPQQIAVSNDDNDENSKQWYEMPLSHLKLPGNKEKSKENFIQAMHLGELNLSESDTDNETDDFDAINESTLANTLTSKEDAMLCSQNAEKNSSDISSFTPELNESNKKISVVKRSSDMLSCAEQDEVDDSDSQDDVSGNQETDDGSLCSFVLDSGNKNNPAFSSNNDFQRYLPEIDSEHTVCSLGRSNSFEIGENMVEVDSNAEAVITLLKTEEISDNFTDTFESTDFCSTKEQDLISEAVSELEKMTESIFNVGDSNYLHADDLNEHLQVAEESLVYYANEVVDNGELNEAVSNLESLAVEEATVIVEENFVEAPTIDENSLQVREHELDNMEELMNPGISLAIESCKYMYGVMEDSPCPAEVLEETVTESIEHVDYVVDEIDMKTANVYCTENNVLDITCQQKVECDPPITTTSLVKNELDCTSSVVNIHGDRAFKCSNPQTVYTKEVTTDEVPLPDSSLAVSISPPCAVPNSFCENFGIYSEQKPPNHTETRIAVNFEVNSNENTVVTAKSSLEHEADGKNRNDLYEEIYKQLRADMPTMSTANTEPSTGSMTEKEIKKTSESTNENLRTEQLTECDILDKTDKTQIEKEITNDNKQAKTGKTLTSENICGNNKLEEFGHSLEEEDRYDNSVIMETDESIVVEEFTEKSTLKMKHETTVSVEIPVAETNKLANINNMPSNTTLCKGEIPVDTAHGETSDSDCVMECVTEETTDTACVQEEDIVEDEDDVEDDNFVMDELEESSLEKYGRNADGDASHEQVESQCQSSGMEHEQCVVGTRAETYPMHHNVPAIEATNKCGDKDWDYVSESVSDHKVVNEFNDVPECDLNCDYGRTHLGKPVNLDSEVNFISESEVQTGVNHSVVNTSCGLQGHENQIGDDSYPVSEASHSGYLGYSDTVTDDSNLMEDDLDFKVYKVADTDEEEEEEQAEEEMAVD